MTSSLSANRFAAPGTAALLLGVALALVSCRPVSEAIFEARCNSTLAPASVEVTALPVEFSVDHSLSIAELTRRYPPTFPGKVLGITKAQLTKDLTFDHSGLEQPGTGRICSRPQVKVVLSFTPIQVLLASSFAANSCRYREVYAHEMRHVNTYVDFLPTVTAEVQEQLRVALGSEVHYFKDAAEAKVTMDRLVNSMWMPYLTAKLEQVEQQQRDIDTFEEYDRLTHACKD
jgi:hypothetical protein